MSSMLGVMVMVVVGSLKKENEEYHKESELQEMRYTRTWKKTSKDVSKAACS